MMVAILSLSPAAVGYGQDKLPSPADQLEALRKEYDTPTGSSRPLSDAERMIFVGRAYQHHFAVALKLVALAEKYPDDPIALDALIQAVWQVNGTPWPVEIVGEDTASPRAFELLQRDHSRSDKLAPLCQRIAYGFRKEYEPFLRTAVATNPHEGVQAAARLSLARYLNNRLERVALCKEQPQLAREFEGLFGKEYLAELLRQDREEAIQEVEAILEQAIEKYADAKLPDGKTVEERARAQLFAIKHLSVGKEAPDIEGDDQDGKPFKLRDYRGKVVLLDFWSYV